MDDFSIPDVPNAWGLILLPSPCKIYLFEKKQRFIEFTIIIDNYPEAGNDVMLQ